MEPPEPPWCHRQDSQDQVVIRHLVDAHLGEESGSLHIMDIDKERSEFSIFWHYKGLQTSILSRGHDHPFRGTTL